MHYSSKIHPKEHGAASYSKVLSLQHPTSPAIYPILPSTDETSCDGSDDKVEHASSPLFLKHPAPPSPCAIDVDDTSDAYIKRNDSVSTLSLSEECSSLNKTESDDSAVTNVAPNDDSSASCFSHLFLREY